MNNVAHLVSDGKIMVSRCKPHIYRSAQFTIGHTVISPPLHALKCLHTEKEQIFKEAKSDLTILGPTQVIYPTSTGFVFAVVSGLVAGPS